MDGMKQWEELSTDDQRLMIRLAQGGASFSVEQAQHLIELGLAQQGLGGPIVSPAGKAMIEGIAAAARRRTT